MNQFTLNKEIFDLNNLESRVKYEDKIFCNIRPDKSFNRDRLEITHSTFANIGFRESNIKNSDLSHNVFIDCYFKKTTICNVDFTGSKFINCQFDNADIKHSDFIYSNFENCCIEYDTMFTNLPTEFNLREKLCRNLSFECLKAGLDKDYKKYFFEERKSREKHYYETFRLEPKSYYKSKTTYQKISAFSKYIQSKLSKRLWGYGESIYQLLLSMIITNIVYSIIYIMCGQVFVYQLSDTKKFTLNFFDSLYFSFLNFFTSSPYCTNNSIIKVIIVSQYFIGVTFMGCFAAAVYKNINRR